MGKRLVVFLFIWLIILNVRSQNLQPLTDPYTLSDSSLNGSVYQQNSGCRSINMWSERNFDTLFIPSGESPVFTIYLNFIFLQRSDGSGNFQENDAKHQDLLNDAIDILNATYSNIVNLHDSTCYSGKDYVPDAKIFFDVKKFYIRDDYGWNNRRGNVCPEFPWYLDYLDSQIIDNPDIRRGINVYFTEDSAVYSDMVINRSINTIAAPGVSCSQFPSFTDFTRSSRVHIPNMFTKFWYMENICPSVYNQPWDPVIRGWFLSLGRSLAHELGHSLWLFHDSPYYGANQCPYSIMNQNGLGSRNYLPPSEIGRIHASMALSNIRTFVDQNTYSPIPFVVSKGFTWDFEIRMYQDIMVESGGDLRISCKLFLPQQSKIEVKSGGKISIQNAYVQSVSSSWNGIIVENGGYLLLKNASLDDYSITVKEGGTLRILENLVLNGSCSVNVERGGYICFDPSSAITLSNRNSAIYLNRGYRMGVNGEFAGPLTDCFSDPGSIYKTGSGFIKTSFWQRW